MLHCHRAIIVPPESGFSHWWLSKWGNWSIDNNNPEVVSLFVDDLLKSKKIELWKLERDKLESIILNERPENYNQLIQCIYLAFGTNNTEVKVIADKNNYYIKHLDDLPKIWPDAKYLHIVRDGRDVACSYLDVLKLNSNSPYKPNFPENIVQIAEEWERNNLAIDGFLKQNGRESLMIKYEDLVINSYKTLSNVCEFLEIEFDDQMLSYYSPLSENYQEPTELLDWKMKTLESPDKNRIKRYLNELTVIDIENFNRVASTSLRSFGYL
jgi:hypothetical protein